MNQLINPLKMRLASLGAVQGVSRMPYHEEGADIPKNSRLF